MATQKFVLKGQQAGWQQLPPVKSATNTSSNGTKVAIHANGEKRLLPPNGCQRFATPVTFYALPEAPTGGELTCEMP